MMNFRTLLSYLLVLTILVYGLPVHSQSPESVEASQTQAVIDAKNDAAASVDQVIWMGGTFAGTALIGCLFCGLPAILAASIYEPPPPAYRIMGKSPEYVMAYQRTYKEAVTSHQTKNATLGCLGGSVVAAIVWGYYYSNVQ